MRRLVRGLGARAAAALALIAALASVGCGSAAAPNAAGLKLEREDFVLFAHALGQARHPVEAQVAATKAAWPLIASGLPANPNGATLHAAVATAATFRVPALFEEPDAEALTGPAASIVGLFRDYKELAARAWHLIGAAITEIERGDTTAARVARTNVSLYIESVYDAYYTLAQIGKQVLAGYRKLGGPQVFGASLTAAEVGVLAAFYSEENARLYPHPRTKLGS